MLKFKMAATDQFQFFWGRNNSKIEVRNNVQMILLKYKMTSTIRLFKYLWPQKLQPN